jgi:O-antigen ligase
MKMEQIARRPSWPLLSLILLLGSVMGLLMAYLVIIGWWQIAAGLLFVVPALIVIHRYPFVSVIIWLALTPLLLHTDTAAERYVYWAVHRGLPLLTLGIIVLSAALRIQPRALPKLGLPELAMAGYVLVSVVSIFLLNSQPQATLYLFYDRIVVAMCLYLIVRLARPTDWEMNWLLMVAVVVVMSQAAVGILSQFAPSMLPSEWMENAGERTVGTLINAAIYTIALMFGGLILFHAAQQTNTVWRRRLFTLCFLLALYGTFISFSRASWMGGLAVGTALVFIYPRFMFKLAVIVAPIGALMAGVLLAGQLEWAKQRLNSPEAENSALSRLPIMVGAYNMFQAKPLFGWGYGNFDRYDRSFYGRMLDMAHDNKDHASHNYFLSILAEQGAVGLLLYLLPMFVWLVRSVQCYKTMTPHGLMSRKLLIMLWLVILFHIVVSNFINMIVVYGLGLWWISLGLIALLVEESQIAAGSAALIPAERSGRGRADALAERPRGRGDAAR